MQDTENKKIRQFYIFIGICTAIITTIICMYLTGVIEKPNNSTITTNNLYQYQDFRDNIGTAEDCKTLKEYICKPIGENGYIKVKWYVDFSEVGE